MQAGDFPRVTRPAWLTQEILDDAPKFPSTRHWVSAWKMAADYYDHPSAIDPTTGKGLQAIDDYDGVYEMTSQHVQMSVVATSPNLIASPFVTAKRDKEQDRAFLAMHYSLLYLYECCIVLGHQFDVVLVESVNDTIQNLLTELRTATSPDDPLVWSVGANKTR